MSSNWKGQFSMLRSPSSEAHPNQDFFHWKLAITCKGKCQDSGNWEELPKNPLIVCSYWFDPNMILKVGQHHKCQINFPNYFFVIDLIILVKFFFLKRTNGRKSCWKRTIGADLEFVKKFTGPNFRVKEFYTLKTHKSRLFSPALNSENASLSVIWPSFG